MRLKGTILACALAAAIAAAPLAGCASQGSSAQSSAGSTSVSASAASDTATGHEEFVIYLGTNDKDTNAPVHSREESKGRAKTVLMKNFGGYTIQEAEGGWRDDDGTEYQEYTLVIHLSDTNIDAVHATAQELIDEFHQNSVLINTQHLQTEFYEGK